MKIAIVTTGLLDTVLPLAKYLSKQVSLDIYVSVYGERFAESVGAFDLSGLPHGLIDEKATAQVMGAQMMDYVKGQKGRVKVRLFKYPSLKIFNRKNFQLNREFAKELNARNYDLVHLNGYRGALMFLYGFLKRSTAKVWTIHDPILHSGEDKWQTRLAYQLFRYLKAHFILHNQGQRLPFSKQNGIKENRVHFVPFGPLEIFHIFKNGQAEKKEPKTILFWGRISPYKGVEYLIKAAKTAKEEVPDLKVVVAGKANYAIDTTELESDPVFEYRNGFIQNPELVKLIERCALVVCPYTDATQSGVLMTAYAFNKPVLATAVGGIPEVVEKDVTGKLVQPKDVSALAKAMVEMLQNQDELEAMSHNIKRLKEEGRFSWDSIASATIEIYEQALNK